MRPLASVRKKTSGVRVNRRDEAVDVGFQPHPAGDVLESDERVMLVQRRQFEIRHAPFCRPAGQQNDGVQPAGADAAALERFAQCVVGGWQQEIENREIRFGGGAVHLDRRAALGFIFTTKPSERQITCASSDDSNKLRHHCS